MTPGTAPLALLGAILLTAAGWDVSKRRIPNPLVFLGLAMGLGLGLVHGGLAGLGQAGLGAVLAFGITFPQWRLGWLGGGDAKLMMVVGAFLGPRGMIDVMLWSLVLHGLVSIGMALARTALARAGSLRTIEWGVPMAVAIAIALPIAVRWPLLPK